MSDNRNNDTQQGRHPVLSIGEIRDAVHPLLGVYGFTGATLFGSYAKGTATETSDVDLYVQVPEGTKSKSVFAFAYDLAQTLGIEVDAYGSHEVRVGSGLFRRINLEGVAL